VAGVASTSASLNKMKLELIGMHLLVRAPRRIQLVYLADPSWDVRILIEWLTVRADEPLTSSLPVERWGFVR
jgi:hypothetical protein